MPNGIHEYSLNSYRKGHPRKEYITVQFFWVGRNIRNCQAKHKRMVFRKADYWARIMTQSLLPL